MTNDRPDLLDVLTDRFHRHMERHAGVEWSHVAARLLASPAAMLALAAMEETGGEPDVVMLGNATDSAGGPVTFVDCSPESPAGRRSLCYDRAALDARKANKPSGNALEAAAAMGVEILDESEYRALQRLGEFDRKTSSWVLTPADVRTLGGALFCDRRFGRVFVYHNGAESYYAARGFRAKLVV